MCTERSIVPLMSNILRKTSGGSKRGMPKLLLMARMKANFWAASRGFTREVTIWRPPGSQHGSVQPMFAKAKAAWCLLPRLPVRTIGLASLVVTRNGPRRAKPMKRLLHTQNARIVLLTKPRPHQNNPAPHTKRPPVGQLPSACPCFGIIS